MSTSTLLTVRQLWEQRAPQQGKERRLYVEANIGKYPPEYEFKLSWQKFNLMPHVLNPDLPPDQNELSYYAELMLNFKRLAKQALPMVKTLDSAKHKTISTLLARLDKEQPSNELLGLYNIYSVTVNSALDAQHSSKADVKRFNEVAEGKLQEIGKRFYKVMHSGKALLYSVEQDEWSTYADCKDHYGHLKVEVLNPDTGKTVTKNAFDAFKEWDKAPRYDAVVFNPKQAGHYDNLFNLWQGFAITPEEGDEDMPVWELLLRICDYNESYFHYVQKWIAHMVQKPWELPGTAIGVSGKQGLGKNAFIESIGMLLSSPSAIKRMTDNRTGTLGKVLSTGAYGYFTSYDEVFGNFNALAGNKILLFLDEATWGGGHIQKAKLKTGITGSTITVNDKFLKQLVLPNYRRFFFASNEGFYYGADADDRRLLPLEFKEENRPSDEFFQSFYTARTKGKLLNNLLFRLQHVDINGWEPMAELRKLDIVTGGSIQHSSSPVYQQWMDTIADDGVILFMDDDGDGKLREQRLQVCDRFIEEDTLRKAFLHYTGSKSMQGWNLPDFAKARDAIFGQKKQKRLEGLSIRGRFIPSQQELQKRLDAQYKWKRNRFVEVEEIPPASDKSKQQHLLDHLLLKS